jgi:hypothetical protein
MGPNASYDKVFAEHMLYADVLEVTCLPGHATNKDQHSKVTYEAHCMADSSLKVDDKRCTPIDCGAAPTVEHGKVTGLTQFGSPMTVTCDEGYSLDSSCCAKAAAQYSMRCLATGGFSAVHHCEPVACGVAPVVEFATSSGSGEVFQDKVTYTLAEGYTLNGKADGEKTFEISCQKDAKWSPVSMPMPVSCGAPPKEPKAEVGPAEFFF